MMPWVIGGDREMIKVHVAPGVSGLLLSKWVLKDMGAIIDLTTDTLKLTKVNAEIQMQETPGSHYSVSLLGS